LEKRKAARIRKGTVGSKGKNMPMTPIARATKPSRRNSFFSTEALPNL
jgi:hypothetical protein